MFFVIVVWDFWGWPVLKGNVCVCWYLFEVAKQERKQSLRFGMDSVCRPAGKTLR